MQHTRPKGFRPGLLVLVASAALAGAALAQEFTLERTQYKRVHVKALEAVLAGNSREAVAALEAFAVAHPTDAETPTVTYRIVNIDGETVHEITLALSALRS